MALPRRPRRRALSAAASRPGASESDILTRQRQSWQERSLWYYDNIGELKFSAQFYARMLKQLRIYPALRDPGVQRVTPINSGLPVELLDRIQDPGGGRSQILGNYGRLMFITGEGFLLGRYLDSDQETWGFCWKDDFKVDESGRVIALAAPSPGGWIDIAPGSAVYYRMWTPHPRLSYEADSPMRAVLDIAEELLVLTKAVRATAVSRLPNGILLMPQEIEPPPLEPSGDEDPLNSPFVSEFVEHISAAIENAGTAEATAPYVLWAASDYLEKIQWKQLHDAQNDYMEKDLRTEAIKRLALGLDMPPEVLLGMAEANHWCCVDTTSILVKGKGWIDQRDLQIGDLVLTLNHENGEAEWQPVEDIYRADVTDEIMYCMKSRAHSSVTTPHHRWPILKTGYKVAGSRRRWTTSAEGFAAADRVPVAAFLNEKKEKVYADDFVRLIVAYSADGTKQEHGNIRIAKFSKREISELRRILTALYGADGFREHAHPTRTADGTAFVLRQEEARQLLEICDSKRAIPFSFVDELTAEQRLLLLASCADIGDGVERDGASTLYQVEPERLAAFAYAAHLSGLKVSYGKREQQTGFGAEPLSWIRWSCSTDTFDPSSCEHSLEVYTGVIWCPVTKNKTWFARHEGKAYFTGNTAWQIQDSIWRSHGAPVATQFCNDLNQAYLKPALQEAGYEDYASVVIAYDEAQVVVNPDRSDDANEAFDRLAISKEALRKAKNFSEDDSMPEDERMEQLAIKLRNPALLGEDLPPGAQAPNENLPAQAETEPGSAPPNGGPANVATREARAASAGRILGAAELALIRCREVAGSRILTYRQSCPECLEPAQGKPKALVASVLGQEMLTQLHAPEPLALVRGGTDGFRSLLTEWGFTSAQAEALCEMVSVWAARTLFESSPPLPAGFAAHIERLREVGNAVAGQ